MEPPAASDNFFQSGFHRSEKQRLSVDHNQYHKLKQEHFVVEEFLDFSNDEDQNNVVMNNDDVKLPLLPSSSSSPACNNNACYNGFNSAESSSVTPVDSCNSDPNHFLGEIGQRSLVVDGSFAGDLCVPYEDIAELEWLSTITEESFSSEDMQKLQLISGMTARLDGSRIESSNKSDSSFRSEMPVPGKARSKRSRTAPGNWASRLLVLSPTSSTSETDHPVSTTGGKSVKTALMKKKERVENSPNDGRRCLHCATDKTPQWRTGPLGPKTLCNACGVRYKSGRLVPEYRPAASPTFVQTKHSNSHRKVLELRRQKEMHRPHPNPHHLHPHGHYQQQPHQLLLRHHQNMMFDHVSNGDQDYLIHQHMGPGYRQLI